MIETKIAGVFVEKRTIHRDLRGGFSEVWEPGSSEPLCQANLSTNHDAFTLRGMHFQAAPHEQGKLVTCVRGRAYDVALDLRPASPTYLQWHGEELAEDSGLILHVPKGCAHGFLTLEPQTSILYFTTAAYAPASGRTIRWDDPVADIRWPLPPGTMPVLNPRDAEAADYVPSEN